MNTVDEEPTPLNREQVISFIGRYTIQFARLASEQGCATLSYMLQIVAAQAEREFAAPPDDRELLTTAHPDDRELLTTAHPERAASPGSPDS
jgi:hypothetical protein